MKTLNELLKGVKIKKIVGEPSCTITALCLDSRQAKAGSLFFAEEGTLTDGHKFIGNAVAGGAVAVVCEHLPETLSNDVCWVQVEKTAIACGEMASAFYDFPTRTMKVTGVTGTNGKTTVATLLFKLFRAVGFSCGLVSTVQNQINDEVFPSERTTPDAIHLQELLGKMRDAGCDHVFMECSSHAIVQERIHGIAFDGAIFTNITHDHLDYHKTFENYIKAKKKFFDDLPKSAFALSNLDDKRGSVMLQNTLAGKKYYALKTAADFKGKILSNNLEGLEMMVNQHEVHFLLAGSFNAYNLLAVYGAAVSLGMDSTEALAKLSALRGAKGRFETYRSPEEKVLGIVDYAHTPDALLNVLTTIHQFDEVKEVITVVGCGGDRDKTKRPEMAEIACKYSDRVILTSDNPRSEDPEDILDDMEKGIKSSQMAKVLRISDRKQAIKTACGLAHTGTILLIAGKGHETYQEIKGIKHDFDDKKVLLNMYELLKK